MARFFYRCKNVNDIQEGYLEAKSMSEASSKLEKQGLTLLELKEIKEQKSQNVSLNYDIKPLNIQEKKDFFNSFYAQYRAGISFFETFNNIISTTSSNNIKTLCFNIVRKIQSGNSFEEAISYYQKIIGKIETPLLIAGEKSGKLEKILYKISQHIKEQETLKSNLISKLTYPALIFALLVFSICVFAFFVIPTFSATIAGEDYDLTKAIVLALIKIGVVALILFMLFLQIKKNKELQAKIINWIFDLKFIKSILVNFSFYNFFIIFSLAYQSGLSPFQAINLSKEAILDNNIKKRMLKIQQMVQDGCEIATAFGVSEIFSDYAISQISTGEKTGELDKVSDDIAQDYKKNYSVKIDALLKTIEPIMLLVAGFFVLILATSAYSKYVETLNSLW